MDSKTLSKFHKFGKVGKITMTVLTVVAILATVVSLAATIFTATLPKDVMTVHVTGNAEFRINEKNFDFLWGILENGFSYSGNTSPEEMLRDDGDKIAPPENQEINTELSFFNQSYSSAKIHSEGSTKVMDATSSPAEYRSTDLVSVLLFLTLSVASVAVAFYMLKRLFAVLAKSETPFCEEIVKKMKIFGFSLLPVAVFSTVGETLSTAFLTAGTDAGINIQWGVLIAFAVTMCLVTVFKYGVQLQKESDETL